MALKDYYQLLEIPPTAPADEVKRAFHRQIARYHPDKVLHLGHEFQAMAAGRAAELTEAYHVLSDAERRAEYDRAVAVGGTGPPPAAAAPPPEAPPAPGTPPPDTDAPVGHQFTEERASRDEFVRKATVARIRQALEAQGGYEETQARGFDLSFTPKAKLFGRNTEPRLLARFVGTVDPEAVTDTWTQVLRLHLSSHEEVCVFLMGSTLASPRALAGAIAEGRRRRFPGKEPILIPMDARNWHAHMPLDAPPVAKELLARLKTGG